MWERIEKFYTHLYDFVMVVCKVLLLIDVGITTLAVMGRYIPFVPAWAWSEEIILTCMIYMALISAGLAVRREAHVRMTALDKYLPQMLVKTLDVFDDLMVLGFSALMFVEGIQYAARVGVRSMYTSIPWLSRFWLYSPVGIAGLVIFLFQLEVICKHVKALKGGKQ